MKTSIFVAALAILTMAVTPVWAETGHDHKKMDEIPKTSKPRMRGQEFRTKNIDLSKKGYLLDQDGNHVNISDYKGKIVLMDFVYSSCKYGHCQYLNNKMRYVMKKFPNQLGKDIQIVSVTFDPEVDTVEKMKEYSSNWESDPSKWAFLTGTPGDIATVAKQYGIQFVWDPADKTYNHSMRTMILDRSGQTVRIYRGMDYKLQEVVNDIQELLDGKKLQVKERNLHHQVDMPEEESTGHDHH